MAFKIPSHLSTEFKNLGPTERQDFIRSYRIWYDNQFTQKFLESLEKEIEASVKDEERKSDFISLFQSKYYGARKKAERTTLRDILRNLNPNAE